jgi:hypothetical protein
MRELTRILPVGSKSRIAAGIEHEFADSGDELQQGSARFVLPLASPSRFLQGGCLTRRDGAPELPGKAQGNLQQWLPATTGARVSEAARKTWGKQNKRSRVCSRWRHTPFIRIGGRRSSSRSLRRRRWIGGHAELHRAAC